MSAPVDMDLATPCRVSVHGALVSYVDGARILVAVDVDLPECSKVPNTATTFKFDHIGIMCRIYKRTWYWYVVVGSEPPVMLRGTKSADMARALRRAVEHVESRFYFGGRARRADEKFVYFAQAGVGGPVKVGYASDVRARLSGIQVGQHEELRLLGCVRGGPELERAIHAHLEPRRIRGEWFEVDLRTLLFFEELESLDAECLDLVAIVCERNAANRSASVVS